MSGASVSSPQSSDLVATGPYDSDLFRYYKVVGRDVFGTVDVRDNHVATLVLPKGIPTFKTTSTMSPSQAQTIASSYLSDHGIRTDGLTMTVAAKNRGDIQTYEVTWQRTINGAEIPDTRLVELDATTGVVFLVHNISRPYDSPPAPAVTRVTAIADAQATVARLIGTGSGSATQPPSDLVVDQAKLQVSFDATGTQHLIWLIHLHNQSLGMTSEGRAVVVDAMTGSAVVVG